jgi:hypothetical protein
MSKLLARFSFNDNPFANYVAENEPDIEHYFVRPPYYGAITERGRASRSMILFGARGAGKSATRITYIRTCGHSESSKKKHLSSLLLMIFPEYLPEG